MPSALDLQHLGEVHAWSRQLFGTTNYNPPSRRFLDEIPGVGGGVGRRRRTQRVWPPVVPQAQRRRRRRAAALPSSRWWLRCRWFRLQRIEPRFRFRRVPLAGQQLRPR